MRKLHQPFVPASVILAAVAMCGAAKVINAQVPGVPPGQLRAEEEIKRHELDAEKAKKNRDPKNTLAEVNDDLSRLNALNEIIGTALAANASFDYPAFAERASEVKARSTRLRTNLALPADEKAEKHDVLKGVDLATLPPSLSLLNKLLTSFTHNPIFSDAGAIDMQLAAKAKQDLDDIIIVSEKVRKTADKLSKAKQ